MQLEVGKIIEGKVTKITNFGAFVDLGEGKTGMVHISEVASTYVKEITDFLQENQTVKVMVINIGDDGKIGLSVKRTQADQPEQRPAPRHQSNRDRAPSGNRNNRPRPSGDQPIDVKAEWTPRKEAPQSFEDMMAKFKQRSDEKMSDLKRTMDGKRGSYSRRGSR